MSYKSVREILNSVFDSSDDTLKTIYKTDGEVLNMVLDESGGPALKVSMPEIDASTLNGINGTEFMQKSEYELLAGTLSAPLFHAPLKNGLGLVHGVGSLTFSRASTGTYVNRYGVRQTASIDEPRFEKEGILIEGESTNYLLNSGTPLTQNVTIPSGTYTLWCEGTGSADTSYGNASQGTPVTFTTSGEALTVTVTGSLDLFQLEPIPFASSYISTTTTAVTRSADILYVDADNNAPLCSQEKTILADFDLLGINSTNQDVFAYDASSKYTFARRRNASGYLSFSVNNAQDTAIVPAENTKYRIGFKYNNGVLSGYLDGIKVLDDVIEAPLDDVKPTHFYMGCFNGASLFLFGHISNVRIYDKALTETQMRVA